MQACIALKNFSRFVLGNETFTLPNSLLSVLEPTERISFTTPEIVNITDRLRHNPAPAP